MITFKENFFILIFTLSVGGVFFSSIDFETTFSLYIAILFISSLAVFFGDFFEKMYNTFNEIT